MVAFDIDGCSNTIREDAEVLAREFFKGENYTFCPEAYYLRDKFAGLSDERYHDFWSRYALEIYDRPPRPGVKEVLDYLESKNVPVCFLSARTADKNFYGVRTKELTENWLKKYGISRPVQYVPKQKAQTARQLGVTLAVEDEPEYIKQLSEVCRVLIYEMPYNIGSEGEKVHNWEEILNIIKSMDASAL